MINVKEDLGIFELGEGVVLSMGARPEKTAPARKSCRCAAAPKKAEKCTKSAKMPASRSMNYYVGGPSGPMMGPSGPMTMMGPSGPMMMGPSGPMPR